MQAHMRLRMWPSRWWSLDGTLLRRECLVLAKVRDRESEWVHWNHGVRHMVLHDKDELADVRFTSYFAMVRWGVVDLLEIDRRTIRRLPHVLERDVLHAHIDFFLWIDQE